MFFGDQIKGYVKAEKIGNFSVDIHYMIKNQDEIICIVGRGTMVQIFKKTGKTSSWSEKMLKLFKKDGFFNV